MDKISCNIWRIKDKKSEVTAQVYQFIQSETDLKEAMKGYWAMEIYMAPKVKIISQGNL